MAKLILSMDGLVLKDIPLAKERMTIGRKPHNDIQIDNLAISGEHAVIVSLPNEVFIEDLGSTNGTLINGQPVKKHSLQYGDVVELGKYRLKYVHEAPAPGPSADLDKTMVLRSDTLRRSIESTEAKTMGDTQVGLHAAPPPSVAEAPPSPPLAAIQVLTGANAGRELDLTKTLTTLGKPGAGVAVIARRPHGYFMTHVEGQLFPVVGGVTLEANKPCELKDHDIIELAGIKMEFFYKT